MVHTAKSFKLFWAAVLFAACSPAVFAQDEDPPTRVARLNYMNGNVSMEPAGVDQWAPAVINRPFTIGDYLYADQSSVAELHMDNAVIRAGQLTSFGFLNLTDQAVQMKMTEGDLNFRIHDLNPNESFEVDTPNAAITLLRDGVYRVHVDPNANTTLVFAQTGEAEVTGGGQAFTLNPGNSASLSGTDQLAFDIQGPPTPDEFDDWCAKRDAHEAQVQSRRYLPPTVVGSEDLDDYGAWNQEPEYGPVWYPRSVPVGWAPYHSGHWAWIAPWGWTWVDDNPWGFAPFHYGRWVYSRDRWGWAPGPCARGGFGGGPVLRPVYAPALVAWFGGSHWGVSVSIGGGGPSLGWVPLGWGEVYTPSYHCSPRYFNNVNVNNTRITNTTNITNVYKTVYVNKTVYNRTFVNVRSPNAVAAMPQSAFASGRSVTQAGSAVSAAQLAHFQPVQASVVAPPVAPTRFAVSPGMGRPAAAPSPQFAQRQVIARNTPPATPASFASRQSYLQQHAGQPTDFSAMHRATVAQPRPATEVRQVARVQPVAVHQGQREGNVPAAVANRGTTPQNQQPNRPLPQTQPLRGPQPTPPIHGAPPNLRQGGQPAQTNADVHSGGQAPTPVRTYGQPQRPEPNAQRQQTRPSYPAANQSERPRQEAPAEPRPQPKPAEQTREVQPEPKAQQQQQHTNQQHRGYEGQPNQSGNQQAKPNENARPAEHAQQAPAHEQHGTPPNKEQPKDDHKDKQH